jgi:hypothetical protein
MRIEEFPPFKVSRHGLGLFPDARLLRNGGTEAANDRVGLSGLARLAGGPGSERLNSLRREVNAGIYEAPPTITSQRIIEYYLLG